MNFASNEVIGNKPDWKWDQLLDAIQCLKPNGNQWVFRAVDKWEEKATSTSEYEVPITSSFDDAWERRTGSKLPGDRRLYESWILSDFKREAHNYLGHLPEPSNFLEWMALGRHYGMPSRLVDFTYSFPVAAYFALSRRKKNELGRIVALNLTWMKKDWEERRRRMYTNFTEKQASFHSEELFHHFAFVRQDTYAVVVNPLRRNPRLANQKGCFLCPGNIEEDVDQNLAQTVGRTPDVKKLVCLHPDLKTTAMKALAGMNVSQATLYPDLSGWAESRRDLVHFDIPDDRFKEELEIAISMPPRI
ncbi:MAG: FRG domain-containing protein [Proteobacteria bacterium]|nr:FRG domain-containing protein [Pseudomonadota bacterium]MBU4370293.1 FRG domain-containing protein [Pseudomonadota bacterium]MBU4581974.1 FRG domain-containing protein [Pseudomonadota bacterium]MCG2742272.1 FRG domain-containing protein [Syntrophaceae bacterium]